jgi:EAL domain-containing protein (putative c-di-GMP-specific phosphodiesterase class I)
MEMWARLKLLLSQPLTGHVSDRHRRRVQAGSKLLSAMILLQGCTWGTYYFVKDNAFLMALCLAIGLVGVAGLAMTRAGWIRASAIMSVHALLVLIGVFCYFDVPLSGVPRSVHMHLLSLAAASILVFRSEGSYLRTGLPLACFATCLVYAGSNVGSSQLHLLPPVEVREIGVWINHGLAFLTLAMVLGVMSADGAQRSAIEVGLRHAVAQGHFVLHYQPQVRGDDSVTGSEALLRWEHPERGLIYPDKFIQLAEETGLIVPIGDWVLRKACAQLATWSKDPCSAHLTLAVNVSASQFRQPDFVAQVIDIVDRSGAKPSLLKLELTESMLAKDIDDVIRKMSALRAYGISLSLDDFGTGYSSLNYLKHLPLDQLKIDRSFVRDLLTDPNDMTIVRTLIQLSQSMNLTLIAEGVETTEQRDWLRNNDCQDYQGYLFSKPLPLQQFDALVAQHHRAPLPEGGPDADPAAQARTVLDKHLV